MLICDFAEFYHIYDYKQIPPLTACTLACGLRGNSRLMMKMTGLKVDQNTFLQAMAVDALNWIVWSKTKNGQKNINKPKSIIEQIQGMEKETQKEFDVFEDSESFEEARRKALKR